MNAGAATAAPWSDAQLRRRIQRAVTFIRGRAAAHSSALYLEVGEHLFENLYRGEMRFYRAKGSWGRTALARIAGADGVEFSLDQLYAAIHYHILTNLYRRTADRPPPLLTPWKWDRLWKLERDPQSLVEVADWAAREKVTLDDLVDVSRLVEPLLSSGGRLDDLLVVGDPGSLRRTPYRRTMRMLEIIESWVADDAREYPPSLRREMIDIIDDMLASLVAPR